MDEKMKLTTAESIAVMALLHGELMDLQAIVRALRQQKPYMAPEQVEQALEGDLVSVVSRYSKFAAVA